MRRTLLVLTVISVAGWSQPAPQQAQPPIPVRIEMPPESVWMVLLKVVLPTVLGGCLGAGITLYGLGRNNKHQATENKANREHQLQVEIAKAEIAAKYRSQDRRWEFRKDVYVRLISSVNALMGLHEAILSYRQTLRNQLSDSHRMTLIERLNKAYTDLAITGNEYYLAVGLAPIATADSLIRPFMETTSFPPSPTDGPEYEEILQNHIAGLSQFLGKLHAAGRKDLWGSPEPEARTDKTA